MAGRKPAQKTAGLTPKNILAATAPKPAVETLEKAPKAPKAEKATKAPEILLDYPRNGETVAPGHYAIRISAKPEHAVEVSIDGGEWLSCRESVGFYWYDWTPAGTGEVKIVARAKNGGPRAKRSEERRVVVEPQSSN